MLLSSFVQANVAFSRGRACGRLGTCLHFFPLNGSPHASVTVGYNAWLAILGFLPFLIDSAYELAIKGAA